VTWITVRARRSPKSRAGFPKISSARHQPRTTPFENPAVTIRDIMRSNGHLGRTEPKPQRLRLSQVIHPSLAGEPSPDAHSLIRARTRGFRVATTPRSPTRTPP
jgi:hypothetical protein